MSTQTTNQPLGPMDDVLLTLAEASARTVLTVEILRQKAKRRQARIVKGNDGMVGPRFPSRNAGWLETMRTTSQTVRSSVADQLVNSDGAAVLERTTTLLQVQVELIARLSEELVEERQRREVAESTKADLQGQLAELEQNLCADMPDLASEDDGMVRTVQEAHELAKMEDQAKDWRRRSRKKPGSARRWLRRSMRRLLTPLAVT